MSAALALAVGLPAAGGLAAALAGPGRGPLAGRVATALTAVAFAAAVALLVAVATAGPVSAVVERADGRALLGLHADRVAVVLLALVLGVSAVAQAFARRYLQGDPKAARFFAATGALTAATAGTATAATLVGLAVAWTLTGVALCVLLGLYAELPAARDGRRRAARAFLVGDGALWLAVAVAVLTWGDLDLRSLGEQAPALTRDGTTVALVACLVVVAALARSAQLPLQGWLPATLAAPTPVSALLHAGVVNGGGLLLIRTSPLFGASAAATHLAFAAGAATAVYGTALMLTKPDVKGALAHSTMGQMGFMVMTCGLGAYAAALFHLVAHGMYKATLFLGSGSAVRRQVRHRKAPPAPRPPRRPAARAAAAAVALLVPAAALSGAEAALPGGTDTGATLGLLLFAWATLTALTRGWLARHDSVRGVLSAVGALAVLAPAYVALLHGVTSFADPALPGAGEQAVTPWALLAVAAVLGALGLVRRHGDGRLAGLHRSLYVLCLSAGAPRPGHVRRARRRPGRHGVTRGLLVPRAGGAA